MNPCAVLLHGWQSTLSPANLCGWTCKLSVCVRQRVLHLSLFPFPCLHVDLCMYVCVHACM